MNQEWQSKGTGNTWKIATKKLEVIIIDVALSNLLDDSYSDKNSECDNWINCILEKLKQKIDILHENQRNTD